jgi:hypothetical protein
MYYDTGTNILYWYNGTAWIPAQGGGGGSAAANTVTITQAAHGFVVGNILYFNGTTYALALADTAVHAEVVGIVSAVIDSGHFTLLTDGYITGLSGLTAGGVYFVSPTTAGGLVATEPSVIGQISKPLLIADSTTSAYFRNFRGQVIGGSSGGSAPAPTIIVPALTLPATPTDGQQAILVDSLSTPNYSWLLQWNATMAKWIYLGGSPIRNSNDGAQSSAAANGVWGSAGGMAITLPRAGTYDIRFGGMSGGQGSGTTSWFGFGVSGAPASNDYVTANNTTVGNLALTRRKAGLAASASIDMYVQDSDSTRRMSFSVRFLEAVPVFVT